MQFESQLPYFLYMTALGAGIMLCYDFFRARRRLSKEHSLLVNIEDFLFAAFCAVAIFYITYLKNHGKIRWQTAIGTILGASLYIIIVKDRIVRIFCKIWTALSDFLIKFIRILLLPVKVVIKILAKPCRLIFWYSGKGVRKVKRSAKTGGAKAKFALKRIGVIMRKK